MIKLDCFWSVILMENLSLAQYLPLVFHVQRKREVLLQSIHPALLLPVLILAALKNSLTNFSEFFPEKQPQ